MLTAVVKALVNILHQNSNLGLLCLEGRTRSVNYPVQRDLSTMTVHGNEHVYKLFLFTLMEVQENAAMNAALDKHEGCNIHGWLEVQRVAGNFHLSVHADHYFAMRSVSIYSTIICNSPRFCGV